MKTIRIIVLSLLALIFAAGAGFFIFSQVYGGQYLPQISKKASLALGRSVSIGHAGLGLSLHGLSLDAGPLTIADDASFTSQPFIKVGRVRLVLDLKSLFLYKKIRVTDIILQSPQFHLIRSRNGHMNIQSIVLKAGPSGPGFVLGQTGSTLALTPNSLKDGRNASLPEKLQELNSIKIQDAVISYIDQSRDLPLDIWLENINANINHPSLSVPVPLSFDACFYHDAPNVHGRATVAFSLSQKSVSISDLKLAADLHRLQADRLEGISAGMPFNAIYKNIAGRFELNMDHVNIAPSSGIEAYGRINISDGLIENFNVIKLLLSRTVGVFIGGNIDNLLNGQSQLQAVDTVIEKAAVDFLFHQQTLNIDKADIQTNIFDLTANGSISQGLTMDIQMMLRLNKDVSAGLIDEMGGLKYLQDDSQRIAIDGNLKGTIPHLKYKPTKDFRKKSRKFLMQEGGNILGILLGGHGM